MTDKQLKIIVREIAYLKEFKDRAARSNYTEAWQFEEELLQELKETEEK